MAGWLPRQALTVTRYYKLLWSGRSGSATIPGMPPPLLQVKVTRCRGKWGHADQKEVDAMLAEGKPHCYRFRVPANQTVTITDCIRGKVSWNTDTLGDFVVMRSNGLPVYNFCVAVDDALMKISHVIRAEEHLPNTLRQVSIHARICMYFLVICYQQHCMRSSNGSTLSGHAG